MLVNIDDLSQDELNIIQEHFDRIKFKGTVVDFFVHHLNKILKNLVHSKWDAVNKNKSKEDKILDIKNMN